MTPEMLVFTSDPFYPKIDLDDTIHRVYGACFDAIAPGSLVRLSFYMLRYNQEVPETLLGPEELLDAFANRINSVNQAVDAEVLFDIDHHLESEALEIQGQFEKAGAKAFFPKHKPFKTGTQGGHPKLHDKTLLFSRLRFPSNSFIEELRGKLVEHVVIQSSANIWESQYRNSNQAILYHGDQDFFDYNLDIWKRDKADFEKDPIKFSKHSPKDQVFGNTKVYAFPRSGRLIRSILKNIRADAGEVTPKIRIATGDFTNRAVARQLVKLAKIDSKAVKVIARAGAMSEKVEEILLDSDVEFHFLAYLPEEMQDPQVEDELKRSAHSKFLLLDGNYEIGGEVKHRRIVWAGSLNYTTQAFKTNSETLVRMEDENVYDELLQHWNQLRYQETFPDIRAALAYKPNGRIYFFTGNRFLEYKPGVGVVTTGVNRALRTIGIDGWEKFPEDFKQGVDAALWHDVNDKAYFFRNNQYIRWEPSDDVEIEAKTLGVDGWQGLPDEFLLGVDAAFTHPENKDIYFFRGSHYCRWKPGDGIQEPKLRTLGVDGWQLPDYFLSGVDAAFADSKKDKIYFFKGSQYCRWQDGQVAFGPAKIADYWPGVMF